jgi:hypothetical protein
VGDALIYPNRLTVPNAAVDARQERPCHGFAANVVPLEVGQEPAQCLQLLGTVQKAVVERFPAQENLVAQPFPHARLCRAPTKVSYCTRAWERSSPTGRVASRFLTRREGTPGQPRPGGCSTPTPRHLPTTPARTGLLHALGEIRLRRSHQDVRVVGHLTIGVAAPVESAADLAEYCKPIRAVVVVEAARLPPITAQSDVVGYSPPVSSIYSGLDARQSITGRCVLARPGPTPCLHWTTSSSPGLRRWILV